MARAETMARRWFWVHVATLAIVFAVLVVANRGQWFFGDEWDFLVFRGVFHARSGLFYPHNEHWSTLPILYFRGVLALVGLRSYWPYLSGLFALHLVVVHLAWRLMRRADVAPPIATGAALVLGLYGRGSENLSWAFQVGFVGSLAAGMALLLLIDGAASRRRVGVISLGAVVSLMFSGISVVLVIAVGLVALAKWGWRQALAVTVPAGTVYLIWLRVQGHYGLESGTAQFHGGPDDIPRYVFGGIAATFGGLVRSDRGGEVLLVLLVVAVVAFGRAWWRTAPELLGLAAAAPIMFAVISQGRGAIVSPSAPRYLNLAAGMLFPLAALAVARVTRSRPRNMAVVLVVCVVLAGNGVARLEQDVKASRALELGLRGQMLAALPLAAHERTIADRPEPTYAGSVTLSDMRAFKRRGQLPMANATAANLAAARLALEVAVTDGRPSTFVAGNGSLEQAATISPAAPNCARVDLRGSNATITRTGDEVTFSITVDRAATAVFYLPFTGGYGGPRLAVMPARHTITVRAVAAQPLILQLNSPATICGIKWTHA